MHRTKKNSEQSIMKKVIIFALLVAVLASATPLKAEAPWPKMKEFQDSFVVDTRAEKIDFVRPLYDIDGTIRYLFVCRGGTDEYLGHLENNYVGPFGCRLSEGNKDVEESLLAEDDVAPWHTRGQYTYEALLGDCGKYAEYGRLRHFRLRGFELTLSVTEPTTNDLNQLVSFRMNVSLKRDETITSKQAERPGYLPPRRDCKTIKKGNLPRMCRYLETGFVWEQCKD